MAARRNATSYRLGFPRLLLLIFERKGVNLEGIPQVPMRPMDELNVATLTGMGIPTDNLPHPGRDQSRQAGHTEQGEVGPSTPAGPLSSTGPCTSALLPPPPPPPPQRSN